MTAAAAETAVIRGEVEDDVVGKEHNTDGAADD